MEKNSNFQEQEEEKCDSSILNKNKYSNCYSESNFNLDQQKQQKQEDNSNGENNTQNKNNKEKDNDENLNQFACKICLELASEPVITKCGHLYCWECIYQWGDSCKNRGNQITCPACKNVINLDELTSIYTGSDSKSQSERKIPKRPQAQRQEPDPQQNNNNNGNGFNGFFFMPGFFGGINGFGLNFGMGNLGDMFNNGNRRQGWLQFIPFILIAIQFLPYFFGTVNILNIEDDDIYDYSYNRRTSNRGFKKSTSNRRQGSQRFNQNQQQQQRYSQQDTYHNTVQGYLDNDWFDFSIVLTLILIFIIFYIIKKAEIRRN